MISFVVVQMIPLLFMISMILMFLTLVHLSLDSEKNFKVFGLKDSYELVFEQYFHASAKLRQKVGYYTSPAGQIVTTIGWFIFEFIMTKFLIGMVSVSINTFRTINEQISFKVIVMQMTDTFESLMFFYWFRKVIFKSKVIDDEVYIHCVQYQNRMQILGDVKGDVGSQNIEKN